MLEDFDKKERKFSLKLLCLYIYICMYVYVCVYIYKISGFCIIDHMILNS